MLILAFALFAVALYCLLAYFLKLPTFKASSLFRRKKAKKKQGTLSNIFNLTAKALSPYIPMSMLKYAELDKVLKAANIRVTPKEYVANVLVRSLVFLPFSVLCLFINKYLALIPLVFAIYKFYVNYVDAGKQSSRRKLDIEKELPRFVAYMANCLSSNRNLIDIIDVYKANYYSTLTEELSMTVADMRTGNQETALQRLELRINSPLLSELIRGMLSSLRGNDMTVYFDNLGYKLTSVWQQRLKEQALKKEPKITAMSYLLFASALISIFVVLGAMLSSAMSIMKG